MRNIRRLVSLASQGDGSQIGTVRFNQNSVHRCTARDFLLIGRALKGDDAGEGKVGPHVQCSTSEVPIATETVQNEADFFGTVISQNGDGIDSINKQIKEG